MRVLVRKLLEVAQYYRTRVWVVELEFGMFKTEEIGENSSWDVKTRVWTEKMSENSSLDFELEFGMKCTRVGHQNFKFGHQNMK